MNSEYKITKTRLVIVFLAIFSLISSYSIFYSQTVNGNITEANTTTITSSQELDTIMSQISNSDKPEDIATFAYLWGYPLITSQRSFDYFTNPNTPPVVGQGPANEMNCARQLVNASFKDVVTPNDDTLYCQSWVDLTKEPLVLKVPSVQDRYISFQFLDAYTNDYTYLGTRASGASEGTYLLAGPNWNGQVPENMTKIWTPTNLAWVLNRILVKGNADLPNVHNIQDKISLIPLSVFEGNTTNTQATDEPTISSQVPIKPQPANIPTTGIKLYDELGQAMINNPLNPADPGLVAKLAKIGIGPGKISSAESNDTIKTALQSGIQKGEKLIDARIANIGSVVNGWSFNTQTGIYGNDYLTRAAITKLGFGANIPQEALYPTTFKDNQGKPYNGINKYAIHFEPGQTPPADGFWSVTMYNEEKYFYDNPLNRYSIGEYTDGLKTNEDGSLDIYIQNQSPGADKDSNWLPSPVDGFFLILRMYLPAEQVLNGTWTPPPLKVIE
jgi:hypothetical protein